MKLKDNEMLRSWHVIGVAVMTIALIQRKTFLRYLVSSWQFLRYLVSSWQAHEAVPKLSEHEGGVGQNEKHSILNYLEII